MSERLSVRIRRAVGNQDCRYREFNRSEGGHVEAERLEAADAELDAVLAACDDLLEACRKSLAALVGVRAIIGEESKITEPLIELVSAAIEKADGESRRSPTSREM